MCIRDSYSTSDNDFRFRNYNSKEFVTDDDGQIVGEYYPLQRNRNGGFRDLHVMQELYYTCLLYTSRCV